MNPKLKLKKFKTKVSILCETINITSKKMQKYIYNVIKDITVA